jgi:hypothetical protein
VKRENNTITAQKTREKRQVAGLRTTRPERKSGRYPRNLKVPARHNVSTSAPPRASAARHRRHFQDQENHWDLVACGSPERGDAVIGRSITYDRDDAPRGFGELDAECRRHGKAKTASGSKVVAAGFPHRQPAPEEVGRRSRLIQVDGVTGRRCSDNVEDCVGQQRPWADLRGALVVPAERATGGPIGAHCRPKPEASHGCSRRSHHRPARGPPPADQRSRQ